MRTGTPECRLCEGLGLATNAPEADPSNHVMVRPPAADAHRRRQAGSRIRPADRAAQGEIVVCSAPVRRLLAMDVARRQELVPPPAGGRVFEQTMRPGLGDCAPTGRIRLDALARWLQDVAYADVEDAGLEAAAVWVVRRARIRVERFPRFADRCRVITFCSGIGRMWAERRTTVTPQGSDVPAVEAVALWVHLDPELRRPTPLTTRELDIYGAPSHDRRISARLRHPSAPEDAEARPWHFRATDCDLADHINNSAYWQPLEEELLAGPEPAGIDVEVEFRNAAQPGEKHFLASGAGRWLTESDGEALASLQLLSRS